MRITTSLSLICFSTPVMADITAQDMLAHLHQLAVFEGVTLTIEREEQSGDTLILHGFDRAYDDGTASVHFFAGQVLLKNLPDGTVEMTWPNVVNFSSEPSSGLQNVGIVSGSLDLRNLVVIASGIPLQINTKVDAFDFSGDLDITDAMGGAFKMQLVAVGAYYDFLEDLTDPDLMKSTGVAGIQSLKFTLNINSGIYNEHYVIAAAVENFYMDMDLNSVRLDPGETVSVTDDTGGLTLTTGPAEINVSFSDIYDKFAVNTTALATGFSYTGTKSTVLIGAYANEVVAKINNASSADFLQELAVDRLDIDYLIPFLTDSGAQPFRMFTALNGLTIGADLWAEIDPQNIIPRDPVNFEFDLSGQTIVHQNIFDDMEPFVMGIGPFQPVSLNLTQFVFSGLGLNISGDGQVDLAIAEGEPFFDMGIPSGNARFEFSGVHTLLGQLGGAGIIDNGLVFGAKALLGIYARPTDLPDSYVSDVTFDENGSIILNGSILQ